MDVVDLPLEQIIPYARNPRKNEAAVATVAASLAEFGWRQLLGFCMLGRDQFIASNSVRAAERAEDRLESAIAAGDSLDAQLVLLAFDSGVIVSEVADRFDVETD